MMYVATVTTSTLWGDLHLKNTVLRSVLYHPPERDGRYLFRFASTQSRDQKEICLTNRSKNGALHFTVDIPKFHPLESEQLIFITHIDSGKEYTATWRTQSYFQRYKHELVLILFTLLYFPVVLYISAS